MLEIQILSLIGIVLFFAFVIKGSTGFGAGLFTVPILLLFLDLKIILPLFLTVQIFADIYLLYKFRKNIDKKIIFYIFVFSIIGVIFGTYFLSNLENEILKKILGVFIILFSAKTLFSKNNLHIQKKLIK